MEVFCLASGPSLVPADVALVRAWRGADRQVFVVNNTHELAPWADLLFVGDSKWIAKHGPSLEFMGRRVTASANGHAPGWERAPQGFQWYQNSGCGAIAWAIREGARRVYLLGYDCKKTGGKSHWHGAHSAPLKDEPNIATWDTLFVQVANAAKVAGVEIVNCSRATALKCFPRIQLESVAQSKAIAA